MEDLKKSISQIFNERLTSPFYGTFLISWMIWNWQIIYLTIFISEESIDKDKITYISENFSDIHFLITYPLISAIILISIMPLITNRAYWVSLLYNQWKINKRNEVQKKELLTIEQSINLREQIKSQEKRFEDLLEDKNLKIKQLETELELIKNPDKSIELVPEKNEKGKSKKNEDPEKINSVSKRIIESSDLNKSFELLSSMILHRYRIRDLNSQSKPNSKNVNFFLVNDIVEQDNNGIFSFTQFGKEVAKNILNKPK